MGFSRYRRQHLLVAVVLVMLVPAGARAQNDARRESVSIDAGQSHADFSVKVMWLFNTSGRFASLHGDVRIDRFRNRASVDARILVDSVRMDGSDKEKWVKSPEFFDAAEWPEIHFVSDGFPLARFVRGGQLSGHLSLRGVTREVTFDVLPVPCSSPGWKCPIEARGSIRRSDFGMKSKRGIVSDKVRLKLSIRVDQALHSAE